MAKKLEGMLENLMTIQERQLNSDELVKARIAKTEQIVLGLATKFDSQDTRISTLEEDVINLKWNEEITDEQATAIRNKVQQRVSKILDYPNGDSDIYYQTFISNIYAYLRKSHNLGSKITTTKKKHFDTVIRGIDAWAPNIQELKARKDKRDEARRRLKNE